ncbi:MAG: hypothetical protein FJ279_25285, partial [Planctomycetes bacterium]|nr:hypothetical protein [Planctomycetota bacterium]
MGNGMCAEGARRPSGFAQLNTASRIVSMWNTLICLGLLIFGVTAMARAAEVSGVDEPNRLVLRNGRVTLALGKAEKGAVVSLVDNATGVEFIAPQAAPRLFSLTFSVGNPPQADAVPHAADGAPQRALPTETRKSEATGQRFTVFSRDASSVRIRLDGSARRSVALLEYEGFGERDIRVSCTASVSDADSLVRWRLSVVFPDALVLEEVGFPFCVVRSPLGADDAAVIGLTKGGVMRKPSDWKVGTRVSGGQPGNLAAQFACCYDPRVGFFTAAFDDRGYPKRIEMLRSPEGLELAWKTPCFTSDPLTLDFDFVQTTFTGEEKPGFSKKPGFLDADWRDAADIYKAWALTQHWCRRTYARRSDIPLWMKSGPAMVRFSRQWLANPKLIERWLTEYWRKHFPDTPLITAYWGWEKVATWVTPDYFPVYPSDEQFKALVAMSRKLGCRAFLWPSGYHWTLTYRKQADGSFLWDDRKRFDELAAPHAVYDRKGQVWRAERSWLSGGETSCMCPGDPWTLDWWTREIALPIVKRGGEVIQVDQVVGGTFPACYSREHAHAPGPGQWMTAAFTDQLQSLLEECQKVERDFVLGFEEPNERFNHLVGIQDYRDLESPYELASVFNYLYHEFLPTFQSNPHAGDKFGMAYCLVNGQIPHTVPSMVMGGGPAILNNDFEEWTGDAFLGWAQVAAYQGVVWNGKFYRDEQEKHDGKASLRLENVAESDIVQVSQNVAVGAGIAVGKRYRLSAWLKTDRLARKGAVNLGCQKADGKWAGLGHVPMPPASSDWTRGSAEFTMPDDATLLRLMIHVEGPAKVWVDDVSLEEVRPDGSATPALRPDTPPDHKLMKQWVDLFHGEGRPYLLLGRLLHP